MSDIFANPSPNSDKSIQDILKTQKQGIIADRFINYIKKRLSGIGNRLKAYKPSSFSGSKAKNEHKSIKQEMQELSRIIKLAQCHPEIKVKAPSKFFGQSLEFLKKLDAQLKQKTLTITGSEIISDDELDEPSLSMDDIEEDEESIKLKKNEYFRNGDDSTTNSSSKDLENVDPHLSSIEQRYTSVSNLYGQLSEIQREQSGYIDKMNEYMNTALTRTRYWLANLKERKK